MLRYSFHSDSFIHLQPLPYQQLIQKYYLLEVDGGTDKHHNFCSGELFIFSVTSSSHGSLACRGQEAAASGDMVRWWRLERCGITVLGRHTEDGGGWAELYTATASPPHTLLHRRVLLTSLCLCYLHIEWSEPREAAVDI